MVRLRDAAVVLVVAALGAAATLTPPSAWLGGLSVDMLFWLRHQLVAPAYAPESSPVAVLAIDEATYQHPDYRDTPRVLWTARLATVVERLLDAGATVVTFDAIFPTSLEGVVPGVDRPFLRVLRRGGREGRIVLASVQHARLPIAPHAGQMIAVGGTANVRAANVDTDVDGVIRRVSLAFARADGGIDASMSIETALRAAKGGLALAPGPVLLRDGVPVRGTEGGTLLVDFFADQRAVPTYSLADLDGCAAAGKDEYFRQAFAGKTVFVGLVLDVEDRRTTSMRLFAAPDEAAYAAPCLPEQAPGERGSVAREAIPGVYIHAFAVSSLLRGETLAELGRGGLAALVFAAAALIGWLTLWRQATTAGGALLIGLAAWLAVCLGALVANRLVLPLLEPGLAGAVAFAVLSSYRFAVTDRDKRRLRQMFGYYLAPSVVDRMVDAGAMPALGGETRTVTIYFSDIAGFTSLSEGRAPSDLVALLNRYLSAMTDIIEAHGGFVDKYIGDAIVAVFGAPHDDPGQASNAVRAAIACQQRLAALNAELAQAGGPALGQRIGLNTGSALVGNIGSARRFNYTVLGDAVNLAARLEGANKVYRTGILASEATAAASGGEPPLVRIDRVAVVGRAAPVDLYVPLPAGADAAAIGRAVDAYLAGDFAVAAAAFTALVDTLPAAAALAQRCRDLAAHAAPEWPGHYTLTEK